MAFFCHFSLYFLLLHQLIRYSPAHSFVLDGFRAVNVDPFVQALFSKKLKGLPPSLQNAIAWHAFHRELLLLHFLPYLLLGGHSSGWWLYRIHAATSHIVYSMANFRLGPSYTACSLRYGHQHALFAVTLRNCWVTFSPSVPRNSMSGANFGSSISPQQHYLKMLFRMPCRSCRFLKLPLSLLLRSLLVHCCVYGALNGYWFSKMLRLCPPKLYVVWIG